MAIKLADALVMIGGDRSKLGSDFQAAERQTRSWVPKVGGILENMLGGLLRNTIQNLTGAVRNFGQQLLKTVTNAAQVDAVTNTFERLVEVTGTALPDAMDQLRYSTRGMVSDTDLMQSTNKFLAMGLADTAEEAAKLSEIATQLGTAMGEDATASMENFALMMANQSIPRLDSFGISSGKVSARIEELQDATEGMTREEAFGIAVMEQAEVAMKRVGEQGASTGASLNRIGAAWDNISVGIGQLFLPIGEKLLGWLGDFLTYISEVLREGDTLNDWLTHIPEFLRPIAEKVGNAVLFVKDDLVPALTGLFDALFSLLSGDMEGALWSFLGALEALGVPKETIETISSVLQTLWSALKDLRDGNVEEFIGKVKAALVEMGVPVEIVDKLETAFRSVYTWMEENIPKIETFVKELWEQVLKPALDGLLDLVKDALPVALIAFAPILFINFVLPMLAAAAPVIALGLALVALGLIWNEYGDQVRQTLGQLRVIIAHTFGEAIGWVLQLLETLSALHGWGDFLDAIGLGPDFVHRLEDAQRSLREFTEAQAEAVLSMEVPERQGPTFADLMGMLQRLGNQDNSRNVTVYGGVQNFGPGGGENALEELWELVG